MRWILRLVAAYAITLGLLTVVALTWSPAMVAKQPVHSQTNTVSHNDYELHKSIGHVP